MGDDETPDCSNDEFVVDTCNVLTDSTGVFAQCHSFFPAESNQKECMFDLCLMDTLTCSIYGQYVSTCFDILSSLGVISEELCNWAETTGCAPECGENMEYR